RENVLNNPALVTTADYVDHIEGRGRSWVCEEDGAIVGFSSADGRTATIWALFVDPAHERRGVGRLLLEPAVRWLEGEGAQAITLATAPGTRAEGFYQAAGFTIEGRSPHGELVFVL